MEQHQVLYRYVRQTGLPQRTGIFSVTSMGSTSAVLCMVRGTELLGLKDPLFAWCGVLEVS